MRELIAALVIFVLLMACASWIARPVFIKCAADPVPHCERV